MIKRSLILMRHAKSDWSSQGIADHDRPLNQRGVRAAVLMGQVIEDRFPAVEVVLASTAVRVQQTLEQMQKGWKKLKPSVKVTRDLYLATAESILAETAKMDNRYTIILVIAHNPGLEELVQQLSGQKVSFPTACVAQLQTSAVSWLAAAEQSEWDLNSILRPREIE